MSVLDELLVSVTRASDPFLSPAEDDGADDVPELLLLLSPLLLLLPRCQLRFDARLRAWLALAPSPSSAADIPLGFPRLGRAQTDSPVAPLLLGTIIRKFSRSGRQ